MKMKKRYFILLFVVIFLLFLWLYLTNRINNIDNVMYNLIISFKSNFTTNFMKFITFFASTYFIIILMVMFFILSFIKGKIFNIINLIIIGETVINSLIKVIVKRERPLFINLVKETSYSFPSGHTMVAVTLYGFLIYLVLKSNLKKNLKILINLCLSLLVILIIISRVYLGVHYFSDVIAGLFLALAYLLLCIGIMERKDLV